MIVALGGATMDIVTLLSLFCHAPARKINSDLVLVLGTHARMDGRTEEKLPGTAPTAGPRAATHLDIHGIPIP